MQQTQTIQIDFTRLKDATNPVYYPLYADRHRNLVLMGGAGSGKSVFATQKLAYRIMAERGHNIIGFRKVASTLRESVYAEFGATLSWMGVDKLWDRNKSEMSFTFRPNGGRFRCMGLDDQEKLKSVARMTSAWMEEATEFVPADYEQINLRLRGRPARRADGSESYRQIILSFNPISSLHWLKAFFFDRDQGGRTRTLRTTYRDNRFIDEQYKQELEALASRDPLFAAVYARGEWGTLDGTVYTPFPVADVWPEHFDERVYGLDFGFNHPSALIECAAYDDDIYLTERIYRSGLTTGDLCVLMDKLGVSRTDPIYADPAEPDRIEEIARAGFNVLPAEKGPGSVAAGIDYVKKRRVYTRNENTNLNAEVNTYCWRKDRAGNVLDEPLKANDHAMDALRYAIWTHFAKRDMPAVGGGYNPLPM